MGTLLERRGITVVVIVLGLAIGAAAQSTVDQWPSPPAKPPGNGVLKTVEGCLADSNGYYTLGTDTGDLYQLSGKDASLRRYTGQTVRITGTVTTFQPAWSAARVLATQPTCSQGFPD